MRTFKFYWLNGCMSVGHGESVDDAFARLGYFKIGSWKGLNYWEEIE